MTDPNTPELTNYRPTGDRVHAELGVAPRGRQKKRGMGILGWLGFLLLALFAVAIGALAVFVISPPTDLIRNQVIAQVKQNTGRDLKISGPVGLTVFPALGVSLKDVSLSGPEEMDQHAFVTMSGLNVEVKALPLLARKIEVNALVLTDPVFNLIVDGNGQKNWDFASRLMPRPVRLADAGNGQSTKVLLAQAAGGAANTGAGQNLPLDEIKLGDVRITNGSVIYKDESSGSNQRLDKINVALALDTLASPLGAKGDIEWQSETISFEGTLTSPKKLMGNESAELLLKVTGSPLTTSFNGFISASDRFGLNGDVKANVPSTRNLARWLGTTLPNAPGFGPMKLNGTLNAAGPRYTFSDVRLDLDGATSTGTLSVLTSGTRPKLTADLKVSELNLNNYLDNGATAQFERSRQPANNGSTDGGNSDKPQSIDDLLADPDSQPGTRVRGYSKSTGWSDDPIDLSTLLLLDADAKLQVGRLLYQKIKIDSTNMVVKLVDGQMRADFKDVQLYGGEGRGVITLDGRSSPTIGANIIANDISALPLLTDAADVTFLEGNGNLTLAVAGRGRSQKEIIDTLNGEGSFNFADGAITGFNMPQAIRSIGAGDLTSLNSAPTEKTDFSELKATFQIKKGIATNTDLSMQSPLLRVTGDGKVMLPEQQVDYTVRPKAVADLSGQGGEAGIAGLEVPVRITGPFQDLKYEPQFGDILKDPNKALEAVKKIGEKFKGKDAGKAINNILENLGVNDKDGDKKVDPKKLLDQLFQ